MIKATVSSHAFFSKIRVLFAVAVFGFVFFAPQPVSADAWQWSSKDLVRQAGTSDASVFLPQTYTQEEERTNSKYTGHLILNERNRNRVQTKAGDPFLPEQMLMSDDGQKIVAFSRNTPGLFVSTDAGETWIDRTYSLTSDSSSYLYNGAISPDGGTLYALWKDYVTVRGVVYDLSNRLVVSFDYGANWHPLPFPTSNGEQAIFCDGWRADFYMLCQRNEIKNSASQAGPLYPLSRDGKVLMFAALSQEVVQSLWMSLNGGNSWSWIASDTPFNSTMEPPESSDDGNTIMLKGSGGGGGAGGRLHLSRNAGQSWRYHDFGHEITAMSTSGNGDTMYVAITPRNAGSTVWKSVDGGNSWINEGISPPDPWSQNKTIRGMSGDGNIIFAPGAPAGPGRLDNTPKLTASHDHGKTWTEISMPDARAASGGILKISRDGKRTLIYGGTGVYPGVSTLYVGTKVLTGSLTVPSTCTIPTGQTTCRPLFDWTTTDTSRGSAGTVAFNIIGGSAYPSETAYASHTLPSGTAGGGAALAAGTYTIKMYGFSQVANTWVLLDQKNVVVGGQDAVSSNPLGLTGSLTVPSNCTIPTGQTTCQPSFDWTSTNTSRHSIAGSVAFNIIGGNAYPAETAYTRHDLPTGTALRGPALATGMYTIKMYGYRAKDEWWVLLDQKSVTVTEQNTPTLSSPTNTLGLTGSLTVPSNCTIPTGQTTCQPSFDWTTTNTHQGSAGTVAFNIIGGSAYPSETAYASHTLPSGTAGGGAALPAGTYTIKLYGFSQVANTWVLLDQRSVVVIGSTPPSGSFLSASGGTASSMDSTTITSAVWKAANSKDNLIQVNVIASDGKITESYKSSEQPLTSGSKIFYLRPDIYKFELIGFQSNGAALTLDSKKVFVGGSVESTPGWTRYCTGGNDPKGNNWQWWAKKNTNPAETRFAGLGYGQCLPPTQVPPTTPATTSPAPTTSANTLTGSLTLPSTCTIPAGQTTCQPYFDWITTNTYPGSAGSVTFNIIGGSAYPSETTYASHPSPTGNGGHGAVLSAGTYTIKLYGFSQSANTWVFLDKKNVVVSGQSAASVPTSAPTSNQPSPFAAPTANKLPTGYFDVANCTSVDGWAFDPNTSSTPVSVNIKEGSTGRILGTANAPRGDVNAIMGVDGNHGFSFPIPASLKDGLPHSLKAYAIDLQTGAETALGPAGTKTITCGTSATAPASVISASVLTPLQRVMDSVFQIFR